MTCLHRASQLLQEYIKRREHLFIVVDEYGVFSGIITLEDVIKCMVGQETVGEFDIDVNMRASTQTGKMAAGRLISVQKDTRFVVYLQAVIALIALLGFAVTARVV